MRAPIEDIREAGEVEKNPVRESRGTNLIPRKMRGSASSGGSPVVLGASSRVRHPSGDRVPNSGKPRTEFPMHCGCEQTHGHRKVAIKAAASPEETVVGRAGWRSRQAKSGYSFPPAGGQALRGQRLKRSGRG